jgi:hypothetical protein
MKIDVQALQDVPAEFNANPLVSAARILLDLKDAIAAIRSESNARNTAEKARSAKNIAQWLTYLPQDCVAAMVRQGWDRSVR